MTSTKFTQSQRDRLRWIVRVTRNAKELRRAQALLDLDAGESAAAVAKRWGVHRSTVYDWLDRFLARWQQRDISLADAPRSGRPAEQIEQTKAVLGSLMQSSPQEFSYRATNWTTPLLLVHLKRHHQVEVSHHTVRRALHGLGYRWKRPRFVFSRRSPNWRQAKGGSSEA